MSKARATSRGRFLLACARRASWAIMTVLASGLALVRPALADNLNATAGSNDALGTQRQELITQPKTSAAPMKRKDHPKLESRLRQFYTTATGQSAIASLGINRGPMSEAAGELEVIVAMEAEPSGTVSSPVPGAASGTAEERLRQHREALKGRLIAAGYMTEAAYGDLLLVRTSPGRLVQLAEGIAGVRYVSLPIQPVPAVVSQGVSVTGASNYHVNGVTGTGVTVAVIDGGFDNLAEAIAAGELPASMMTQDFTGTGIDTAGSNNHGIAVAEIIHDMAPGANLMLLKISNNVHLGLAKDFAISNGAKIISMSLGFPGDGFVKNAGATDGIVNNARAQGVLWVNAAGNYAAGVHWRGQFVDANGNGLHEFAPGDEGNTFFAVAGTTGSIVLTWDDWPQSNQDYDLYVCSQSLFNVFGFSPNACLASENVQDGTQPPLEVVPGPVPLTDTYFLVIANFSASGNATFELYANRAINFQYAIADHSIAPPADATGAIAVGAIDKDTWTSGPQEPYSSQGPTNDGRTKPDIAGPDDTTSFTFSPTFPGTSASAPHVAGALALLQQAHPTFTPDQLENLLYTNAVDMGAAGMDNVFGRGRLQLPAPPALGVSVSPSGWAIGAMAPGTSVQMDESNDLAVSNTGNVAETLTLRIANPGAAWVPGLGAGTESFHLQGLFVGSTDAPGPSDFQTDDTLFAGSPVEATAAQFGIGSTTPGFHPDAGSSLLNNLIAYWKLEEVSGSRVDSVGANGLADNNTVSQAAGKRGAAAQFVAASGEYLSLPDNAALSTGDIDFTVAAWVYADTLGSHTILGKYQPTGNQREYLLDINASGTVSFSVSSNGTDAGTVGVSKVGAMTAGQWYFVVAWHDSAANTISVQVNNGTPATLATSAGVFDGAAPFQIGAFSGSSQPWDGRIDEVGLWKRVLTAQERTNLYNGGAGNTISGAGDNGVGVPPGDARDLWFSFAGPTSTTQSGQQSIVVEVGAVQTP